MQYSAHDAGGEEGCERPMAGIGAQMRCLVKEGFHVQQEISFKEGRQISGASFTKYLSQAARVHMSIIAVVFQIPLKMNIKQVLNVIGYHFQCSSLSSGFVFNGPIFVLHALPSVDNRSLPKSGIIPQLPGVLPTPTWLRLLVATKGFDRCDDTVFGDDDPFRQRWSPVRGS